jgi:alpha-tubulin suppressor-like RCC1 family protein
VAALSACGGSSSSSNDSVPNTASIFYAHNLVFRNSTTLSTGYNGFGQLGTGNLDSRSTAAPLHKYYPFAGTATGGDHSVAFFNNSTVRTWGYNGFGQLGNASTTYSSTPVKTIAISGVTAVAAGAYHSLALRNDGTISSWGSNSMGQLGVGSLLVPSYSGVPVTVGAATAGAPPNVSAIAANGYHSLALANGFVWAWGFNGSGQLGVDPLVTGASAAPLPVGGLSLSGVSAIAAGGAFNYAVVNGEVWAWGANDNGQLGNGTTTSSYTPVQVMKDAATPLTDIVQIAAGIQHGLAKDSQGRVWAWGFNSFGQLGNYNPLDKNTLLDSPYAVQVLMDTATPPTVMSGAAEIRAFGSSSMARIGTVWYAWGDNYYGQLGIGKSGAENNTVKNPVKMSGY